jgi:hypothetical protein
MKRWLLGCTLAVLFGAAATAFAATHTPAPVTTTATSATTTSGSDPMLVGDQNVESNSDQNGAGYSQAWPFTATTSGTATAIYLYADPGTTSRTTAHVGLYTNSSNNRPATLLGSGSFKPTAGSWGEATITATVTAGTKYWLAELGTGGTLTFRDQLNGNCQTDVSGGSLSNLPSKWGSSTMFSGYCPASIYVGGTAGSPSSSSSSTSSSTTSSSASSSSTTSSSSTRSTSTTTSSSAPTTSTSSSSTPTTTTTTSTPTSNSTSSSTTTTSSTTSSPPPPPPPSSSLSSSPSFVTVGVSAAPTPACSTVVAAGQNPATALASAAAGSTVCLANGNWPNGITISQPLSKAVTLAAQNPGQATVHGFTANASVSNLTVEGLSMTEGFTLPDALTNDTFQYLTMENWGSGSGDAQLDAAFWIYTGDSTHDTADSNVRILYTQIDNVPQCLETGEAGITFSHNVCGPDIGHNDLNDVHYVQAEGADGLVMDNNAFLGPPAPGVTEAGSHLNVDHSCGSDLQFNNNIVWHTEAAGESVLWGDDCAIANGEANNNLIIETTTTSSGNPNDTYSILFDNGTGMTASNNTIINPTTYGAIVSENSSGFTAHNNLFDATHGCGFDAGSSTSGNASSVGDCDVSWTPAWEDTTWAPNDGSPWNPPPADYYKPTGIASTYGYQGSIGP